MSKSLKQSNDEKASKVQHKLAHKGKIISLRVDTISNGDSSYTWDIVEHPGAAVIVPVDQEEKFIFVKQWRRAVGKIILEFPAGALEKGEDPLLCANRELQEEIGFKANRMISLGGFYSAPGFCTEYLHLYLGMDLEESSLPHDENEAIDVVSFSLKEALEMIDKKEIVDAKTIAGILCYLRWKERNK